jgi:hypothetical protein
MKQRNKYREILHIFEELKDSHPLVPLGKHLETLRDRCGDFWCASDTSLYSCLQEYQSTLSLCPPEHIENIEYILQDGQTMFEEIEEE